MSTDPTPGGAHPIVVTGMGVITPLGDTVEGLLEALFQGRSAVGPSAADGATAEARIADFDANRYAKFRGMRVYHRHTQMGMCAGKLALDDAGVDLEKVVPERLGLVAATTYSHLETLFTYDEGLMTVGVDRTNPTLMALSIESAPGAAAALAYVAKAFSLTVSDGDGSSLAALATAARLLADDRADLCVVLAGVGPCLPLVESARLSSLTAPPEAFRVLDEASGGLAFGEAAAAVVLEREDRALARGARPRARILGHAARFAADPGGLGDALAGACARALEHAGVAPGALAVVSSSANGVPSTDEAHVRALARALGPAASRVPLTAIKGNLGEIFDVAGLIQTIVAAESVRRRQAPPIARLERPRSAALVLPIEPVTLEGGEALLVGSSSTGACSALVLGGVS